MITLTHIHPNLNNYYEIENELLELAAYSIVDPINLIYKHPTEDVYITGIKLYKKMTTLKEVLRKTYNDR